MSLLRIGSRGSKLALWQAHHIAALLQRQGHETAIEIIRTTGDKVLDVALAKVGTKGMFTKEIEEALAAGEIDLAVHSMKDVPTELAPEFLLAATLEREDPRDALLAIAYAGLDELPRGARVGSSSLRRQAQLLALRPDLQISPLRGNVDTRIRKLQAGEYDAILLAVAGVKRLQLQVFVKQIFSPQQMLPATGQGALALEIVRANQRVTDAVRPLNHLATETTVACERALLRGLGGGCQVPIAALATLRDGATLELDALVARPDGSEVIRDRQSGANGEALGAAVAQSLWGQGAERILRDVYDSTVAVPQQP